MMVIDFKNQEIWLLKNKSWKLKSNWQNEIWFTVIYIIIKKKEIYLFLRVFSTKWDMSWAFPEHFCHVKWKARFSCKILADQHGGQQKTSQKREGWGGSNKSLHVHVSRAVEKGKTFIFTIKIKVWYSGRIFEMRLTMRLFCCFLLSRGASPPHWTLREKTLPIVCDFGRSPLTQVQLNDRFLIHQRATVSNPEK